MDNYEKEERLAIMMESGLSEKQALSILEPPEWLAAIERMKAKKKPIKYKPPHLHNDHKKIISGDKDDD